MEHKHFGRGVLLCLCATISWGGMFPVMTSALRHVDPYTFTCFRYAIAGILFYAVMRFTEAGRKVDMSARRIWLSWFFGTCGFAGFQFLVFEGQRLAGPDGALTASIMMATMPLQAFLFNWVVRRAVPKPFVLGFILLSFCGVILVVSKGNLAALIKSPGEYGPQLLIIVGALCWVVYTAGASFLPGWSPVRYTTVTTGLGLISATAITGVLLATGAVRTPGAQDYVAVLPHLAYMSLIAGFVGVLAWNIGNKILTPLNGTLFMDIVPITAFTVSAATGVIPQPVQIIGACMTVLAVICNNVGIRRTSAVAPAKPASAHERPQMAASAPSSASA